MANFTLAISAVKSAYDTFLTAQDATQSVQDDIDALVLPTKPEVVLANSDWNNYTTALLTYESDSADLEKDLADAQATQREAEIAVIEALGYDTGDTPATICLDQWVKVVGSGGGILTYTHYIGAGTNSTYLQVSTTLPTAPFPNVTD